MSIVVAVLAALLGLAVGAWLGERGRRIDAQKVARTYRPLRTSKAKVVTDQEVGGAPAEQLLNDEQIEEIIKETMRETGCNRQMAEEDVAQMLKAGAIMGLEH